MTREIPFAIYGTAVTQFSFQYLIMGNPPSQSINEQYNRSIAYIHTFSSSLQASRQKKEGQQTKIATRDTTLSRGEPNTAQPQMNNPFDFRYLSTPNPRIVLTRGTMRLSTTSLQIIHQYIDKYAGYATHP